MGLILINLWIHFFSEEHKKKMSQSRIGQKMSDETKKKIFETLKNRRNT